MNGRDRNAVVLPSRSRLLVLGVVATSMLMIILDGSIVSVALASIRSALGFSAAGLSWVVDAYVVSFGSLLLLAGRLGDLIGRKRVFLGGLTVFTASSALAGAATTPQVLIAARFLQGIGSALTASVALGIVVTLFPEPGERGRAIAVFSFTGAAGASIGQVLGGVLADEAGWQWIFGINVPIGLAVILLAARVLPADRGLGLAAGADVLGAVLLTAGLVTGIGTIVLAGEGGRPGAALPVAGAAAVGLLALFVRRQRRADPPLLPLRVFRSPNVSAANLVQVLMLAALFSFQVLLALDLQQVQGYGATGTGLAMLPAAVGIGAVSLGCSARLIARFGERTVLSAGLAPLALGLLLARLPVRAHYGPDVVPAMVLVAGFGLALPALTSIAMSGAGADDAGVVSGLFNTTQQIGAALGVAVLSSLAAARSAALRGRGSGPAAALTGGYRLAFAGGAVLLILALLVALVLLRSSRPERCREPAAEPAG